MHKAVIQYTRNNYTLQLNDKQETMIPLSAAFLIGANMKMKLKVS